MKSLSECANYCLNCKVKPCSLKGCPLQNDIPAFIEQVKQESYKEAYKILSRTTVLPGVCGRICPHQKQCQGSCVRGIKGEPVSIGELEAYVFDKAMEQNESLKDCWANSKETENNTTANSERTNKKVAVIGGGPAGLTAAAFLAKERN